MLRGLEPSVSELLARRARAMLYEGAQSYDVDDAIELALYSFRWDAKASLPLLKDLCDYIVAHTHISEQTGTWQATSSSDNEDAVFLARMAAGDGGAFEAYARWIGDVALALSVDGVLAPLAYFPDHPQIEAAVQRLFNRPNDPWTLDGLTRRGNDVIAYLAAVEPGRRVLLKGLADETVIGTMTVGGGQFRYTIENGPSGGFGIPRTDRVKEDQQSPLRRKDVFAWRVSTRLDLPDFKPYGPPAERDQQIERLAAMLRNWPPPGGAVPFTNRFPTEQIDFGGPQSLKIHEHIALTGRPEALSNDRSPILSPDEPITIQFRLMASSGDDQRGPERVVSDGPEGAAMLPGLTLHLQYADQWFDDPRLQWVQINLPFIGPGNDVADWAMWTDVPSRGEPPTPLEPDQIMLPSGRWHDAGALDLRESFDMTRPGVYRFWLSFDGDDGRSESVHWVFIVRSGMLPPPPMPSTPHQ